jgi:hypothetical protein
VPDTFNGDGPGSADHRLVLLGFAGLNAVLAGALERSFRTAPPEASQTFEAPKVFGAPAIEGRSKVPDTFDRTPSIAFDRSRSPSMG